jgi:hypothetical protein
MGAETRAGSAAELAFNSPKVGESAGPSGGKGTRINAVSDSKIAKSSVKTAEQI